MKHIIKRAILYSITVGILYSCSSLHKIAIQVAIPPKYTISPEIQSIAILNRSRPEFIDLNADSFQKSLIADYKRFSSKFFDHAAADTTITTVAKAIFNSQRFDVVVPLQRNIVRHDPETIASPLDSVSINQMCKDFDVDAVLVLENFTEQVSGQTGEDLSYGYISLGYNSAWRFYQPRQIPAVLNFPVNNMLSWDCEAYWFRKPSDQLPTIKEALIDGGISSAMEMAYKICPEWLDIRRYYYITRNKEIDTAIPLIKLNKWDEASDLWIKYSSVPSKSLRSKIEYNLALAAEMKGDINLALEWGGKSIKTKHSRNTKLYLKELGRLSKLKEGSTNVTDKPKRL